MMPPPATQKGLNRWVHFVSILSFRYAIILYPNAVTA